MEIEEIERIAKAHGLTLRWANKAGTSRRYLYLVKWQNSAETRASGRALTVSNGSTVDRYVTSESRLDQLTPERFMRCVRVLAGELVNEEEAHTPAPRPCTMHEAALFDSDSTDLALLLRDL